MTQPIGLANEAGKSKLIGLDHLRTLAITPLMDTDQFWVIWYKWIYYPVWSRLDGLLVGVSLAGLFQFFPAIRDRIIRRGNLLLLAGLGLITGAYFLNADPHSFYASIFGFPVVAIAYGTIVAAAVSPSCILYRLHSGISSNIATLSNAIYLAHKGMIHLSQPLFMKWGIAGDSNLMYFLCIVMSILGALASRCGQIRVMRFFSCYKVD